MNTESSKPRSTFKPKSSRQGSRHSNPGRIKLPKNGHNELFKFYKREKIMLRVNTIAGLTIGKLIDFDNYTVTLLVSDEKLTMYFKHAVNSVEPADIADIPLVEKFFNGVE